MRPTDQPLTDDQIAAGIERRVGGRVDPGILRSIVAQAAVTPQERARPAMGSGRSRFLAVLVAAALGATGVGIIASGSRPSVPLPSQPPAPSMVALASPASPSEVPSPTPSTGPCATETVDVATGGEMPPAESAPLTVPAGMLTRGVYLTHVDASLQTDVWAASTGSATRIASIVGRNLNVTALDDVSRDGTVALLAIGEMHMNVPRPECSDLYLIRTDGSGATQLTHNDAGHQAFGAAMSADGRYVAYQGSVGLPGQPMLGLLDVQGGGAPQETACAPSYEIQPAWAPTGDRLAVRCKGRTLLATVDGSRPDLLGDPVAVDQPLGEFIALAWTDASHVLVVDAVSGTRDNAPVELRTVTIGNGSGDASSPSVSAVDTVTPWLAQQPSNGVPLAPDGHAFVLLADPDADDPSGDRMAYFVVDVASAHATQLIDYRHTDIGWSPDSRSLVYVDWSTSTPVLALRDLSATRARLSVPLPPGYTTGLWEGAPGGAH